MPGNL
jgi:hypothetical protein